MRPAIVLAGPSMCRWRKPDPGPGWNSDGSNCQKRDLRGFFPVNDRVRNDAVIASLAYRYPKGYANLCRLLLTLLRCPSTLFPMKCSDPVLEDALVKVLVAFRSFPALPLDYSSMLCPSLGGIPVDGPGADRE